jgi:hypothetical protein
LRGEIEGQSSVTFYRPAKLLVQRRNPALRQFFLALLTLPLRRQPFRTERLQQLSGLSPARHFRPSVWTHTPLLPQVEPAGQGLEPEQGCGGDGGIATQMPLTHSAFAAQTLPGQHGWSTAPQGLQVAFWQLRSVLHALPAQHTSFRSPHSTQMLFWHTRPVLQVLPAQHT